MKNLKLLSIITVLSVVSITSCQKQPNASFSTDKSEYLAGETIKLTNTSIDAKSYKWTLPGGQTETAANVDYITDPNSGDGTLTFKLEAFSKNGKKDDETSKTINIKAATGNAIFWQKIGSGYDITVVQLNGITSNITSDSGSAPDCGTSGCAVFNSLKVGSYNWTASDGTYNWSGTITISKNGCSKMELQ